MPGAISISARFANMSFICSLLVVLIHVFKRSQESGSCVAYLRLMTEGGVCRMGV